MHKTLTQEPEVENVFKERGALAVASLFSVLLCRYFYAKTQVYNFFTMPAVWSAVKKIYLQTVARSCSSACLNFVIVKPVIPQNADVTWDFDCEHCSAPAV